MRTWNGLYPNSTSSIRGGRDDTGGADGGHLRVLIVGSGGLLGTEILRRVSIAGHDTVAGYFRHRVAGTVGSVPFDITNPQDTIRSVADVRPDAIVNCAYLKTDWVTTATGPAHLAVAAERVGAHLVHLSSDAVFSGRSVYYDETCPPDPMSPYGAAKASAETAVRAVADDATIVRTSWIIGSGRSPFEILVRSIASGEVSENLFVDDIRCPVDLSDLTSAVVELMEARRSGLFHVAGRDSINRFELGRRIAERDGLPTRRLKAGSRSDYGTAPQDIRLNSMWTQQFLETRLRSVREFL